jgi:hypothetical protein
MTVNGPTWLLIRCVSREFKLMSTNTRGQRDHPLACDQGPAIRALFGSHDLLVEQTSVHCSKKSPARLATASDCPGLRKRGPPDVPLHCQRVLRLHLPLHARTIFLPAIRSYKSWRGRTCCICRLYPTVSTYRPPPKRAE